MSKDSNEGSDKDSKESPLKMNRVQSQKIIITPDKGAMNFTTSKASSNIPTIDITKAKQNAEREMRKTFS